MNGKIWQPGGGHVLYTGATAISCHMFLPPPHLEHALINCYVE